jgi:Protein of unknown function (DUF995)
MGLNMRHIAVLCVGITLAGCASGGMFGSRRAETPPPTDVEPAAMTAAEIKRAISGKSWRWTSPKNSGVTLYASDGTSLVQVDGKGNTTGKWQVKDGYLCESFAPATFMPQGVAMSCQPITGSGNSFRVGQADFTLA